MNAENTPVQILAAEIKTALKRNFDFEMPLTYKDMDFSTVKIDWTSIDASYAKFINCNFAGVKFNPKNIVGADFDGCNFTKAKLQECRFSSNHGVTNCNFTEADLRGTSFYGYLSDCDLSDAKIKGMNLDGAKISNVKF